MTLGIHQLRCFVAVAEHRHVTRAASSLFMTQPALSAQIRSLEELVGVQLFFRHPKGMELTPAGEAFLVHARLSLAEMDNALDAARAAAAGARSVIRVGLIVGTQIDVISRVLRSFREATPGARLEFTEYTFEVPSAGLTRGETDVAFIVLPMHTAGIGYDPLERPGVVAVLPEDHPLSERQSLSITEILGAPWVSADTTDDICREYWLAVSYRTSPPVTHHRVRTMDKFIQLVASGEAIGIAPAWVEHHYGRRPVRFIPVPDVESPTVALAWPADHESAPPVVQMRAAARAATSGSRPGLAGSPR